MNFQFPPLEAFKAYLLQLPPEQIVSQDWNCGSCPIAVFMHETGFSLAPTITPTYWADARDWALNPMPAWAMEFVYWVDKSVERRVTAEECLEILTFPSFNPDAWVGPIRKVQP